MGKKKPAEAAESPTFEQSLEELEQIVVTLESGKLGLADSLAAYERGVSRLNGCYQMLTAAERRIELVQSIDGQGRAATAPFDDEASDELTAKSTARSRRRTSASPRTNHTDDDASLF